MKFYWNATEEIVFRASNYRHVFPAISPQSCFEYLLDSRYVCLIRYNY